MPPARFELTTFGLGIQGLAGKTLLKQHFLDSGLTLLDDNWTIECNIIQIPPFFLLNNRRCNGRIFPGSFLDLYGQLNGKPS